MSGIIMKKVLFGLGNPGAEYEKTRHNAGAYVLTAWLDQVAEDEKRQVVAVLPKRSMNESGITLKESIRNLPIESSGILVIHDDVELPLGKVRLTKGGSAKGHNGVKSVYKVWGSRELWRLRLGIGRPPDNIEMRGYVLGKFEPGEKGAVDKMTEAGVKLLSVFAKQDEGLS